MGVHIEELSANEVVIGVKLLIIGQFFVAITMGLSKCAVAVFLLRIIVQTW